MKSVNLAHPLSLLYWKMWVEALLLPDIIPCITYATVRTCIEDGSAAVFIDDNTALDFLSE